MSEKAEIANEGLCACGHEMAFVWCWDDADKYAQNVYGCEGCGTVRGVRVWSNAGRTTVSASGEAQMSTKGPSLDVTWEEIKQELDSQARAATWVLEQLATVDQEASNECQPRAGADEDAP